MGYDFINPFAVKRDILQITKKERKIINTLKNINFESELYSLTWGLEKIQEHRPYLQFSSDYIVEFYIKNYQSAFLRKMIQYNFTPAIIHSHREFYLIYKFLYNHNESIGLLKDLHDLFIAGLYLIQHDNKIYVFTGREVNLLSIIHK